MGKLFIVIAYIFPSEKNQVLFRFIVQKNHLIHLSRFEFLIFSLLNIKYFLFKREFKEKR